MEPLVLAITAGCGADVLKKEEPQTGISSTHQAIREYHLHPPCCRPHSSRIKAGCRPPKLKPGQRGARPYSIRDRDALFATCYSVDWQALVTLTFPTDARVLYWSSLRSLLASLKQWLTNACRRRGFPPLIFVTEFDEVHFHIGFARQLTQSQRDDLRLHWIKIVGATNNQGGLFNYRARGGGTRLQKYLGKDMKGRLLQKYQPEWIPSRTDRRLWFCIGVKHRPAKEGAAIRALGKIRRRRTKRGQSLVPVSHVASSSKDKSTPSDSAHATTYSTVVRLVGPARIGERGVLAKPEPILLSYAIRNGYFNSTIATTSLARAPPLFGRRLPLSDILRGGIDPYDALAAPLTSYVDMVEAGS